MHKLPVERSALRIVFFSRDPHDGPMITPAQIRGARAMLDLTQKQLAEQAGLSVQALGNIETGASDPKASTLAAIQAALETAGAEFIPNGVRVRGKGKDRQGGR